jgi:dTDP-4-dehydrorhamnose 3,5-epimerase
MEILRLGPEGTEGLPACLAVRQISVSWAAPGRVNAFHIHAREQQDELWTVVQGSLFVWLVDMREQSPTAGARRSVLLSSEQPSLLHIPSGVAHGYKAGCDGATVVYSMDAQFDPSNPNEGRIPWDLFGAEIWEDDRG